MQSSWNIWIILDVELFFKLWSFYFLLIFGQFFVLRYREANPDAAKDNDMDNPEEWFETDSQRELGQIFSGQSKMFDSLREIQKKLDEIVGRQERSLGLLSAVQTNQGNSMLRLL